ncbi:DEAD/DEAH box helicase [Paracidovorax anthurii]|uniref:UvrD-like helicase family protein n=1 Tax=Paracidovorax anthurii TaxID=78229 RepID=A0A328Z102_9BURK|nr:3'-5' exonuclease [Paracidovorax anthurii]RAR75986.1 UvrD-like helicase family protein [Paracidovorax anthurii]
MATLIPAIGTCASRMTSGERRLAERLEHKLDDDYRLWYDVPVGPKQTYPDFVVMHPRRGVLILETKDWRLDTVRKATRQYWEIAPDGGAPKIVKNPLEQARHCALEVVRALERDPQLVQPSGPYQGKLAFPWGHGVVFTRITRRQFEAAGLGEAIEPHYVVCQDEMLEDVEAEAFQERLWRMFPHHFGGAMSLPQIDRVRWHMFPEVRVPVQGRLFEAGEGDDAEVPDLLRVMDLQQEQLARSLGEGHRVIHGVAGSGKTMILGYRAEYLAKLQGAAVPDGKPVLVLCYNEPLAVKLASVMEAKGLADRVHCLHFHKWARAQLVAFGQGLPAPGLPREAFFVDMVDRVIQGVDKGHIPSGQYGAVLIDEGHDFAPEWLKLVGQMVDPATNSLLVLYDDAQSIYARARKKQFSFRSVGIQAQGRTTILRINYRNTRQILQTAHLIAADLLTPEDSGDDGVPLLQPVSCGRDGEAPVIVRLPTLRAEAAQVAERLAAAHQEGHAWGDMAVLCRHYAQMEECATALRHKGLPHHVRKGSGSFHPADDTVKVMTMHASKGLEFPVVAMVGAGQMPAAGEDEREEARLFYVAATRATHRLVVTVSGEAGFGQRLEGVAVAA